MFVARYCGSGPAIFALVAGSAAVTYFVLEPRNTFAIDRFEYKVGLVLYAAVGLATIAMIHSLEAARRRAERHRSQSRREDRDRRGYEKLLGEQNERLRATLASIGDAVIATDDKGGVTFMNAAAESLTGWTNAEATGVSLAEVVRTLDESSREALPDAAAKLLVSRAVLVAKDGTERLIEGNAAPIRCPVGKVVGRVLVFRSVAGRR